LERQNSFIDYFVLRASRSTDIKNDQISDPSRFRILNQEEYNTLPHISASIRITCPEIEGLYSSLENQLKSLSVPVDPLVIEATGKPFLYPVKKSLDQVAASYDTNFGYIAMDNRKREVA
jgi:hypothetical protein